MNKAEIQFYLGNDYVVKKIIEDENELFAFYVSRNFEESGGNDRYALIGVGPVYYNKKTKEIKKLGAMEFHSKYTERELLKSNIITEDETLNLEKLIKNIKSRNHINGDEFEIIMHQLEIDLYRVSISSTDMIHEIIESPDPIDIEKFRNVFEKANMEFKQETPNKIVLKNN